LAWIPETCSRSTAARPYFTGYRLDYSGVGAWSAQPDPTDATAAPGSKAAARLEQKRPRLSGAFLMIQSLALSQVKRRGRQIRAIYLLTIQNINGFNMAQQCIGLIKNVNIAGAEFH
jgi:hypothetical protein